MGNSRTTYKPHPSQREAYLRREERAAAIAEYRQSGKRHEGDRLSRYEARYGADLRMGSVG